MTTLCSLCLVILCFNVLEISGNSSFVPLGDASLKITWDDYADWLKGVDSKSKTRNIEGTEYNLTIEMGKLDFRQWGYELTGTDGDMEILRDEYIRIANLRKSINAFIKRLNIDLDKKNASPEWRRMYAMLQEIGRAALSQTEYTTFIDTLYSLKSSYWNNIKTQVCNGSKCVNDRNPDFKELGRELLSIRALNYYWRIWHDDTGRMNRAPFETIVELSNRAARLNNWDNHAEYILRKYEDKQIEGKMAKLWEKIQPFYELLHSFVRKRMIMLYNRDPAQKETAPTLADRLGDTWVDIYKIHKSKLKPFNTSIHVTEKLVSSGYNAQVLYHTAEVFFQELGFPLIPVANWERSRLEYRKDNQKMICEPRVWNLYSTIPPRIKTCTLIDYENYWKAHKLTALLHYHIEFQNLFDDFRGGPSPAIYEAIGGALALPAVSMRRLKEASLLEDMSENSEINHLFIEAMDKIFLLPYYYLLDQFRFRVYRGNITSENYNCEYWKLRKEIQGIEPPMDRSEGDFDAGSSYYITNEISTTKYFLGNILQYQIYKYICTRTGDTREKLHMCTFNKNPEVGKIFQEVMKLGASKPPQEIMPMITGQAEIDAGPLLEYFKPLRDYLWKEHLKGKGYIIGWEKSTKNTCSDENGSSSNYSLHNKYTNAKWNYDSNITNYNRNHLQSQMEEIAESMKEARKQSLVLTENLQIQNADVKRRYTKMHDIGYYALERSNYSDYLNKFLQMAEGYRNSTRCMIEEDDQCFDSDSQTILEQNMGVENPEKARFYWDRWIYRSDRLRRDLFMDYVKYSNTSAQLNNYPNYAEKMLEPYEDRDLEKKMAKLWEEIRPLYLQLHAYIRRKLYMKHSEAYINRKGPIPSFFMGDTWVDTWEFLEEQLLPFNSTQFVTNKLIARKFTPQLLYGSAQGLYFGLGFGLIEDHVLKESVLEYPKDGRQVECEDMIYDYHDGETFKLLTCTNIDYKGYKKAHKLIGQLQYHQQFKTVPEIFKKPANPAIYEAIGGAVSLSAISPNYLEWFGVIDGKSEQLEINQLFIEAFDVIYKLPYYYMLDKYRFEIFRGQISRDVYNCEYWKLREDLQGVQPSEGRTGNDFDTGANYYLVNNIHTTGKFLGNILQYQIFSKLCEEVARYHDKGMKLKDCDFQHFLHVGRTLKKAMKLGATRPPKEVMQILTGQTEIVSAPLIEYFQPLEKYLKEENAKTNEYIGWVPTDNQFCYESKIRLQYNPQY